MHKSSWIYATLLLLASSGWLTAAPPNIQTGYVPTLREMDYAQLAISATDPQGLPLTYHWTFSNDPTGVAFFRTIGGDSVSSVDHANQVKIGLPAGPNFPAASYVGETVTVRVDVSNGQETSTHSFDLRVSGVNHAPELRFNTAQLGTLAVPRMTGEGIGVNTAQSSDPDGGEVKFVWRISNTSHGRPCEAGLVLLGKETSNPGLIVPQVTALPSDPMRLVLEYVVEDGMHQLIGNLTGYMASERGCQASTGPVVTATASPTPASFGQTVHLTATASGSNLTYQWRQLGTTSGSALVPIANAQSLSATFVAPNRVGTLTFEFTATDQAHLSASARATVSIVSGDGGGNPGGGNPGGGDPGPGSGDPGTGSGESPGEPLCGGQEGNEPAVATLPSVFTIESGNPVSITARDARDPDNTRVTVNGQPLSGVFYRWELVDGAGVVSSIQGSTTATVTFETPFVSTEKVVRLAVNVSDAAVCGTRYEVQVHLTPSQPRNLPPVAHLSYRMADSQPSPAPPTPVMVTGSAEVVLEAGESEDDGALTFEFTLNKNLVSGDATLAARDSTSRTLRIEEGSKGNLTVSVTATDSQGLSSTASIAFQVEPPDNKPIAVLRYRNGSQGELVEAPAETVEVDSPASIRFDASSSQDEGALTYSFILERHLTSGGTSFRSEGDAVRVLDIQSGSQGTLAVSVTVTDPGGQSDTTRIDFKVKSSPVAPVASLAVRVNERLWDEGTPVDEGSLVTLDASDSFLPNGDPPDQFQWRQVAGSPVDLLGTDSSVARFRVPEGGDNEEPLVFELVVSKSGVAAEPKRVEIPVAVAPIYFGQVAFGPLGALDFRTVFLLVNVGDKDAEDIQIEFFDQLGQPLDVALGGELWDQNQVLTLRAGSSRRLRFSSLDPLTTTVGWARLRSSVRLTGMVLYQLVDRRNGDVESEISLFSSPRSDNMSSFYDPAYGVAAAIANPGDEPLQLNVKLVTEEFGPNLPVATKPLIVGPGQQQAFFLDATFFGGFPPDFESGTLVFEAVSGQAVATLLKTRSGVAISTLPLVAR